jgi:hypothetical protein
MSSGWSWLALFGLGAYHGINPAMGWLFAVALGLQEKSRRAVLHAIPPIALGHVLSIGAVVAVMWLAHANLPATALRYIAAALLIAFGMYRLIRARHPSWVGMRVGFRDLMTWSFLMATAHGAGLMLLPVLIGWPQGNQLESGSHMQHLAGHEMHGSSNQASGFGDALRWLEAVGVHSAGYLIVTALIALLVYEKFGLALLNRAWINLDLIWVFVLIVSGVLLLLI